MQLIIELPGIKAVTRNETSGHYFKYRRQFIQAEKWIRTFGKQYTEKFDKPVDVCIIAYYDTRGRKKITDAPNIDDKIFTDILIRWKKMKGAPAVEKQVWFIEDDAPKYLRYVTKRSIASDHYKIVIIIKDVVEDDDMLHIDKVTVKAS